MLVIVLPRRSSYSLNTRLYHIGLSEVFDCDEQVQLRDMQDWEVQIQQRDGRAQKGEKYMHR